MCDILSSSSTYKHVPSDAKLLYDLSITPATDSSNISNSTSGCDSPTTNTTSSSESSSLKFSNNDDEEDDDTNSSECHNKTTPSIRNSFKSIEKKILNLNQNDDIDVQLQVISPLMSVNGEKQNNNKVVVVEKRRRMGLRFHKKSDIYKLNHGKNEVVISIQKQNENIDTKKNYIIIILLLFVNLLNYIDRFTIAGKQKKKIFFLNL
jgi:hypothetical protein